FEIRTDGPRRGLAPIVPGGLPSDPPNADVFYWTTREIQAVRMVTTPAVTQGYEGQTLVLALWHERLRDGEVPAPGQGAVAGLVRGRGISYDSGTTFIFPGETNYRLGTGWDTYTPRGNDGFGEDQNYVVPRGLSAGEVPGGCRLHLVQFATQALHEYRAGV